ncbi:MAG: response regulator, partial [Dehalococcoidia bacterium]
MTPDAPVRVLVLEDEDSIRRLTVDLLTDEGFEVRAAPDGRQGLAILDEWRPDVIVLDLMMPVMDGRA